MPKFNISLNRSAVNLSASAARKKEMIVPRIITPDHSDSGNAKAMPIASIYLNGSVGRIGYNLFKQIPYTFTATKTTAKNYEIYGELPAGEIVLSVRTPRTRNLLPYPYSGIEVGSGGDSWEPTTYYNYPDHSSLVITDHSDGTFEWSNQTTANYKSAIVFEDKRVLYPAGTYTMSHAPGSTYIPQLAARPYDVGGNALGVYSDENPGRYGTGRVTFTCNVPFYLRTDLYAANAYSYSGGYARPQLELGSNVTEYEPPNPATLTTITLPRALQAGEYLSFADQKIMPTGTPVTLPALQTLVGENVLMIENYPRLTSTITLDL